MRGFFPKRSLGVIVAMLMAFAGCATAEETAGRPDRPVGSQALTAVIPQGAIYFFQNRSFGGNVWRAENVLTSSAGATQDIGRAGGVSSLQWNLPPGVVVILYERPGASGNQVVLWGKGQATSLADWKANDKVSQWAWYYVGGVPNPPQQLQAGLSPRPAGAMNTGHLVLGTIELYRDRDFRGNLTAIGPVRSTSAGDLQKTGGASDKMSSVRWNLPPGIIVILYEDANGHGKELVLWGSGEYPSVSQWNFNDKASRWAWYDVGQSTAAQPTP